MASSYKEVFDKVKKELESGEIKLLGQVRISQDEYIKLKDYVSDFVMYSSDYSNPKPDIRLSLFLVQLAINNYEGRYWQQLIDELGIDIPASKQNYIGKTFAKTIEYYDLFKLGEDFAAQQYVENIKAHAFVTNYYMDGFFEFAYAFFENNLFRQVPENEQALIEDVELLSAFMEQSLSTSSDSIKNGTNVAAKSYKLLKSTRRVFAQCDVITINKFFYPIMKFIDEYYYDDRLPEEKANRFEEGFIAWCKKAEEEVKKDGRKKRERILVSKKPFMVINPDNEKAKVVIPPQKFRPSDCESGITVLIENQQETIEKKLELWNSFGINISEPIEIEIPAIFDEIHISFSNISDKEYVIPARPYRIVTDEWKLQNNLKIGNNIILIQKDVSCFWNKECRIIYEEKNYINWDYYFIEIDTESICQIGKHSLSIAGEYSSEPVFDSLVKAFSVKSPEGKDITTCYRHPYISFEVDYDKLAGTVLFINEEKEAVKDIETKGIYPIPNKEGRCAVTIDLNELRERLDGRYKIDVDIPGEGRKTICDYLILRQFKYRFDCRTNIYREFAYLDITSWLHWVDANPEWEAWDKSKYCATFEVPLDADMKAVDIEVYLYDTDEKYIVSIPVGIFSYGFSAEEKNYLKKDYIWYSNIANVLYIRNNLAQTASVYYGKETGSLYSAKKVSEGVFEVDISEIREKIIDSKYSKHYINVVFDNKVSKYIALPCILRNVEVYPKYSISYIDEKPCILVDDIVGDAVPFIKLYEHNTDNCLIERMDLHKGVNYLEEIPAKGLYDLLPCMDEEDELGLFSNITEFKMIWGLGKIDISDLTGKSLRISGIRYEDEILELRHNYYAEVQKSIKNVYMCYLKEVPFENGRNNWKRTKNLGVIRLEVLNEKGNLNCKVCCYSEDDKEWMSFYYDRKTKGLLRPDSKTLLNTKDYQRFYSLDEDVTVFMIDKNNIKSLRGKNAI